MPMCRCLVRIDGRIDLAIEFEDDSQSLLLTARCGALPREHRERVLQALLDANFYGAGSGGATLSTNSREGASTSSFREPTRTWTNRGCTTCCTRRS
jgi:hypothetical protein